jgi:hypothetical protein
VPDLEPRNPPQFAAKRLSAETKVSMRETRSFAEQARRGERSYAFARRPWRLTIRYIDARLMLASLAARSTLPCAARNARLA